MQKSECGPQSPPLRIAHGRIELGWHTFMTVAGGVQSQLMNVTLSCKIHSPCKCTRVTRGKPGEYEIHAE